MQVNESGEASKYPSLCQQNLHIVSVGVAGEKEETAADELLRQLMMLPRPVRVEFARTIPDAAAAASPSPYSPVTPARGPGSKNHEPFRQAEANTKQPPVEEGRSGDENGGGAGGRYEDAGGRAASRATLGNSRTSDHGTDAITEKSPVPAGEHEYQQGENVGHSDNERLLATGKAGEESHHQETLRPQRRGTLPRADWEQNSEDVDGVGVDNDRTNGEQSTLGAEAQEGKGEEKGETMGGNNNNNERPLNAPRRPQRHGTLPEGSDWEENLRNGRGGTAAFHTVSPLPAAASAAADEESEEASWSMAEETTVRSTPTNGSHSPTRSFYTPNTRRSQLAITPDGSDSSMWSRGLTDGVDSIQRWLHVRF